MQVVKKSIVHKLSLQNIHEASSALHFRAINCGSSLALYKFGTAGEEHLEQVFNPGEYGRVCWLTVWTRQSG